METSQLIMKSNIVPIYITSMNAVTPLITINSFYTKMILFFNAAVNILQICIQTVSFIMKEIIAEVFTKLTPVKIVYIIGIYNLFMLAVLDSHQRKIAKQKEQIASLEKQLKNLKKSEKIRDEFEQLWIHDIKSCNQETNNKMTSMEKKIKKMEKNFHN
jgi:hypothetical protein